MIRRRFFGIFGKVFLYTMLILLFVIGGMFLLFSNQIQSTIALTQQQQFSETIMRFVEQTHGKTTEEVIELTEDFHRWNTSFALRLLNAEGEVLFQTDGFTSHIGINELSNAAVQIVAGESTGVILGENSASSVQMYRGVRSMHQNR